MPPSEVHEFHDQRTRTRLLQLTDHPSVNHSLYFSNCSFLPGDGAVAFVSYRNGSPNLYLALLPSGQLARLTDRKDLNPFSAVAGRSDGRIFYTTTSSVLAVDTATGAEQVLADFPGSAVGNCNLSGDGLALVTALREGPRNHLVIVHTDGSGHELVATPPREVGHVQLCPSNSDLILYSSGIEHRMWLYDRADGSDNLVLEHTAKDWLTHESWLGRGEEIIYVHWPYALCAIKPDGSGRRTVAATTCWHPVGNADGSRIVCDTTCPDVGLLLIDPTAGTWRTLCYPESSNAGTQWSHTEPAVTYTEETYGPQWTHPHPSFSRDGSMVVYTSDATGHPQVYVAYL